MAFPLCHLLLLLLVLAAAVSLMGGSTTSDLDTTCPAETTITGMDDEETISWRRDWFNIGELERQGFVYMHPDKGFKGVSVRAFLNRYRYTPRTSMDQGSHDVFFTVSQDTCFNDSTAWWWLLSARVWVTSSRNNNNYEQELHFDLSAGGCWAGCTVHLHGARYKTLDWPIMVAHGPSRLTRKTDEEKCKTEFGYAAPEEYNSCLKPPRTTQDTPAAPESTEDTTAAPESTEATTVAPENTEDTTAAPESTEDTTVAPENIEDTTVAPESTEDTYNHTIALMTTLTVLCVTVIVVAYFVEKEIDHIMEVKKSYSSG